MSTIPITKRGAEMLKDELQRLKTKERPAVVNALTGHQKPLLIHNFILLDNHIDT